MNRIYYGIGAGLFAAIGGGAVAVQSCAPDDTCTLEAQPSVEVALVDRDGNALTANSVWFVAHATDGQEDIVTPLRAECVDEACTYWTAGHELPGGFEVTAAACGDVQSREVTVAMDDADCHVATQRIEFQYDCDAETILATSPMPPTGAEELEQCTLDPAPSVRVKVVDAETGMLRPVARVGYARGAFSEQELDEPNPPAPTSARAAHTPETGLGWCASDMCDVWNVGREEIGRFTVWAEACDTRTEQVTVDVKPGTCHVDTQDVVLTLDCSAPPPSAVPPAGEEKELETGPLPPPSPLCSREARPSILLETVDAKTGEPMGASAAGFSRLPFLETELDVDAVDEPRPTTASIACETGLCDEFRLGTELEGRFSVWAEACGERSEAVAVEVPKTEDGCHVETQTVKVELECRGCFPPHEHRQLARR